MRVRQLIEFLSEAPPEAHVELSVYGHTYNESHRDSHGSLNVYLTGNRVRISPGTWNQPPPEAHIGTEFIVQDRREQK